jgi:hypothetical protein
VKDTSPEAEAQFAEVLNQRSGSDRVLMCFDMLNLARLLMTANIRSQHPDITETELRVRIFERTYREDFTADEMARIIAAIHAAANQPRA